MKKKTEITTTVCDCCGENIPAPMFFYNDGRHQAHKVSIEDIDLCTTCSARILQFMLTKNELSVGTLKSVIDEVAKSWDIRCKINNGFDAKIQFLNGVQQ